MSSTSLAASSYLTGSELDDDGANTIRQPSLDFSDNEGTDDEHTGDYSTRMEELLGEGDDESDVQEDDEETDGGGGFLYTGVDAADISAGYRDRLRDVLGADAEEDDETEVHEVERSLLLHSGESENLGFDDHEPPHGDVLSDHTPSTLSMPSLPMTPPRMGSPGFNGTPSKMARPFLHPSVSRLRSSTPQSSRVPSTGSAGTSNSHIFDGASPSPSHFSAMSPTSSHSNLHASSSNSHGDTPNSHTTRPEREVFKWTQLRSISHHIYTTNAQKAITILGASPLGSPTVLVANGLICVGTDEGKICVYDFKQTLKCICGNDTSAKLVGSVTALALSHDHTYVASGHSSGHIQLFDLQSPQAPARFVTPTTLVAISSGRKEGHLHGSRILSISFVAGRHTAVVSADEHGLAFYHSLGKVLFVEASDILRILGKYPQDDVAEPIPRTLPRKAIPASRSAQNGSTPTAPLSPRRRKTRYTILAMMPLPLGTSPHPTDAYNVVALLTPTKLVIVGLKPSPKTWFKCPRDVDEGGAVRTKSRWKGTLAWFPSILPGGAGKSDQVKNKGQLNDKDLSSVPTTPILVYSWSNNVYLIRVSESRTKQLIRNKRTGKLSEIEVGRIVFEDAGKWSAEDDILAIQWLNANQVIILTATTLEVYDAHLSKLVEHVHFDGLSLVSPSLGNTVSGAISYADSVGDVAHSVRVYKGKIFLLGREQLQVGTLLTWADRILSFVQGGDFLSAIDLARSYYVGDAPGNRNGLPDEPELRKDVVGEKMRDLMVASARYAFSEDRMTDGTHITPDGRGVDRTSLFEGLVTICARACVALNDFEFLFEDLFQQYDDAGITRIFLLQLEAFILDNEMRYVPPRITQRLVALHEEDERPDLVERVIWHIDPACLDINQAIHLCQRHHLYDALMYVYTRALRDYVAPAVELLGLIRKVQQYRKSRAESVETAGIIPDDTALEPIGMNAYKIYPYLANVLSGLTYPSEEPLADDEAFQAKKDVYAFLFFGRSSVWPLGEGGKLVLTSDEEGGIEPTYPYARLLLRFDSESFLHSLDIAFEDTYLNDESQGVGRLVIVRILLEILSSGNLPPADVTFVNIFIARNVPKYPQFLQIATSALHGILIDLADDPDQSTREDRQLAAEYLLSVYNPHESGRILRLFEKAGFYRILRSWHRQERQWAPLLSTYLDDPDLRPSEMFYNVDDVLNVSARTNKDLLPPELISAISDALPRLLQASITSTAVLLDKHMPDFHGRALEELGQNNDHKRFIYLRHLLGPRRSDDEEYTTPTRNSVPSLKVAKHLRQLFISMQCQYHPNEVIKVLKYFPPDQLDWTQVLQACESNEVFDAVVWALNWRGDPRGALSKAEIFEKRLTLSIVDALSAPTEITPPATSNVRREVEALEAVGRIGIAICLERSQGKPAAEVHLEDIWFQLLSSQINCVQSVSECCSAEALSGQSYTVLKEETADIEWHTLSTLRSLVQETFGSLVSISSTHAVSFPRLFKRLVNSATHSHSSTGAQYTEFRTILTGMLESYRSDGDMLIISKHLVDRDLFETVADVTRERARGWAPLRGTCSFCGKPLLVNKKSETPSQPSIDSQIVVSRTGAIYHSKCLPPEV